MLMRQLLSVSSAMLVMGALSMALPGCGGGEPETNPDGTVKDVPIVNPAPGALKPEH